jgi:hypothetical protein
VSISSDDLGFFMVSLMIKDGSLRSFMKNMMIDLLSTSGMMFLLLQKHWMNSQRDSFSFCTMLAICHLTLSHSQVALMLLMNYRQRFNHDRIDLVGSPMREVLADDDRQIDR